MNQPISSPRLLSRFIAYRAALAAVEATRIASGRWQGWAWLRDQALRAAGSIAHNLAEGNGHRPGSAGRARYQRIALGSALELEAALDLAAAAGLGVPDELNAAIAAAGRVAALCTALTRRR
ncbi:MAG: four helix bundle protein [Kofleriaceae bacterium]|nr:four helix bundle protein [Kofleriaceae bacterium]MCB9571252.1 four helix bundle protein [Kofleriaceae bacterium]